MRKDVTRSPLERRKAAGIARLAAGHMITKVEKEKFLELFCFVESKFQVESEDKIKSMEQKIGEAIGEEERQRIVDDCAPEIVDYREHFPPMQRSFLLAMLMSWVEMKLIWLCRVTDSIFNEGNPFNSRWTGGGLYHAMEHLEAKAKINTSAIESSWTEAKYLQEIRNCIIHHGGYIKDSKIPELIYCIIKSMSGIEKHDEFKDGNPKLVLKPEFLEKSANNMYSFIEQLIDLIMHKLDN